MGIRAGLNTALTDARAHGQHTFDFAQFDTKTVDLNLPIDYQAGKLFAEVNINIGREVCNSDERPRWNAGDFFGRTFAGIE